MKLDFLIIGGQRCGTGWLAQCLREHPGIFMAPDETRFFDLNFEKGVNWWRKTYFTGANTDLVVGEKTANYLTDKKAALRIQRTFPDVKLICILRNPIDRLNSAIYMVSKSDQEILSMDLKEIILKYPKLISMGKYSSFIGEYLQNFSSHKIHFVSYDLLTQSPELELKKIFEFLRVDREYIPPSMTVQTKPGSFENSNFVLKKVSRYLLHKRSPFRSWYSNIRPKSSRFFDENAISILRDLYAQDIKEVKDRTKIDLDGY